MEKALHGRTLATLSATGIAQGAGRLRAADRAASSACRSTTSPRSRTSPHNPNVVAVLLEVLQGEGGIQSTTIEYLRKLRAICDERSGC